MKSSKIKPMSCPPLPQCVFHTNLIGRLNLLLDKWKSWGFSWSWACSFKCFMRLMCWGEGWKTKKKKDVWNHFFLLWTMAMPWNLLLYTYVVSIYNQSNSWADDVVSITSQIAEQSCLKDHRHWYRNTGTLTGVWPRKSFLNTVPCWTWPSWSLRVFFYCHVLLRLVIIIL